MLSEQAGTISPLTDANIVCSISYGFLPLLCGCRRYSMLLQHMRGTVIMASHSGSSVGSSD